MRKSISGFTIVELLIVIVVIAILATISIVAYNGIQNRAYDAAVQSDIKNLGQKFLAFKATDDRFPVNATDFNSLNLKVSRNAYGNHYTPPSSNGYNMAYCWDTANDTFVIVAASKSGTVYAFKDGSTKVGVGPMQTITTTCSNNGVSIATTYSWFYSNGSWQSWIGG